MLDSHYQSLTRLISYFVHARNAFYAISLRHLWNASVPQVFFKKLQNRVVQLVVCGLLERKVRPIRKLHETLVAGDSIKDFEA